MLTPPAKEYAYNIRLIHGFFKSNDYMKVYYNDEIKKYFETFEYKCNLGLFEELDDCNLYLYRGIDNNGLDLWYRLRENVRVKNIHQKMSIAVGSWGVGAEVSHYLLVLLCYRYNVQTGIRRYSKTNFNHPYLQYIDRIQRIINELYNIEIYTNHINISMFKAKEDFVSVGIGPLSYSDKYLKFGNPKEILKGDDLFIAKRMKVYTAPMPVSSKEEIKIFNHWMKTNPSPTDSTRRSLAELYLSLTDGKVIFPKLPSMIKSYKSKWTINSLIKAAELAIKNRYDKLLKSLSNSMTMENALYSVSANTNIEYNTRIDTFVTPPINAIDQNENIPMPLEMPIPLETFTNKQSRKCCHPFCNKMAHECGGWYKIKQCRNIQNENLSSEQIKILKKEKKREYNLQRYYEKKRKKN